MHAGRAHPEQHAVADRLQLRDVLGGRAGPRHRADAVVLTDEHKLLAAHHQVRRADAKLGVHDRVAHLQLELLRALAHAAVADRLDRACARAASTARLCPATPSLCRPPLCQPAPAALDRALASPASTARLLNFLLQLLHLIRLSFTDWCLAVPPQGLLWFTLHCQPNRQVGAVWQPSSYSVKLVR